MTREELKAAFFAESPVVYDAGYSKIKYKKISALIYRKNPGTNTARVTAELLDYSERSVTIVEPHKITLAAAEAPAETREGA